LDNIDDGNIFSNFENHILSILKHLTKDNLYFIYFIVITSDFFIKSIYKIDLVTNRIKKKYNWKLECLLKCLYSLNLIYLFNNITYFFLFLDFKLIS